MNLKVEPQVLVPQVQVRLRPDADRPAGADARRRSAAPWRRWCKGTKVGEIYQDQKSFDVVVRGVP